MPPEEKWRWPAAPGYLFRFDNRDDAQEYGLAFGTRIRHNGSIEPREETPEGMAERAAQEGRYMETLERLTRPTPVSELPKAERRKAAKAAMARRK